MRKKGIGQEDKIHLQFGQLIQKYKLYNRLKNCLVATYMPFGEKRSLATGVLLKKKGTIRGIPDWLFIKNNGGIIEIIWLEFKAEKGKQSPEQIDFQKMCLPIKNMRYYLPRSVNEGLEILEQEGILDVG